MADENTTPRVASLAARVVRMSHAELIAYAQTAEGYEAVKALAGSALTQAEDAPAPSVDP